VMPLKMALRNTRFATDRRSRPVARSEDQPQQHGDARIVMSRPCRMAFDEPAHARPGTALGRASANASMSVGCAATDVHPPGPTIFGLRRDILTGRGGPDLIESILIAQATLLQGCNTLRRTAVIGRRHPELGKKRVNPLCEVKPRSKLMSAIGVSVATSASRPAPDPRVQVQMACTPSGSDSR